MSALFKIRRGTIKDVKTIQTLSRQLGEFENLGHLITATTAKFKKTLFGKTPYAWVLIAEVRRGKTYVPAGMALYFFNYSTFKAQPGLYLEDLFVLPEFRSEGIGLSLLKKLAQIAKQKKCARLEWVVLDWNKEAIKFYKRHGADLKKEWIICRVTDPALTKLSK